MEKEKKEWDLTDDVVDIFKEINLLEGEMVAYARADNYSTVRELSKKRQELEIKGWDLFLDKNPNLDGVDLSINALRKKCYLRD